MCMCSEIREYMLHYSLLVICKAYLWILLRMHIEMCATGEPTSALNISYAERMTFYLMYLFSRTLICWATVHVSMGEDAKQEMVLSHVGEESEKGK